MQLDRFDRLPVTNYTQQPTTPDLKFVPKWKTSEANAEGMAM